MRAFVAIEVGEAGDASEGGGPPTPRVHLTLRFLGEIEADRVGPISRAIRTAVSESAPFEVTIEGVGAFPTRERPRVVWIGVTEGRERLRALETKVAGALAEVGFPPEPGEYVPHVTLFRVRSPWDRQRARALLDDPALAPSARTTRVAEVVLKESVLTPAGPRHRTVDAFPLRGGTGDGG